MNVTRAAVLGAVLCSTALAQESQEELQKKREAKLAEPFFKKANWITDYDSVLEESRKSGKLVFAYFTRSYAP